MEKGENRGNKMRKYLKEIGIRKDDICVPMTRKKASSKKRQKKFKKQRKKYGFDSRETFYLSVTSAMWLYEHLQMYVDTAGVDLNFHELEIAPVIVDEKIWEETEYGKLYRYITIGKPQKMKQKEAIDLCSEYLKDYILSDEMQLAEPTPVRMAARESINNIKGQQAFRIYAELFPFMWR